MCFLAFSAFIVASSSRKFSVPAWSTMGLLPNTIFSISTAIPLIDNGVHVLRIVLI